MKIHYSIIRISDLAVPINPKIGIKTSQIIASNPHNYCKELLDNIYQDFFYILEDLEELISRTQNLTYENISTFINDKYENTTSIDFTNKLNKFILVSLFSSELVLSKLKLTHTISEINNLGCLYGKISEYDFLVS